MPYQPLKFFFLPLFILAPQSNKAGKGIFETHSLCFGRLIFKMSPNLHLFLYLDPFQRDCRFSHQEVESVTRLCELGGFTVFSDQ